MGKAFVGRARELAELEGGLADAASGKGSLFVVSGEPGIGKSRMVDELASIAAGRGFRVAWGRCWQGEGAPAYWPWMQILRALGEELPLLSGAVSDGAHARFALYRSIVDILERVSTREPSLLIIDDLHAADLSSLTLLQRIVGELRAQRTLVVCTCRDRDTNLDADGSALVQGIVRDATFMPMRRFASLEVVDLANRMGLTLSDAAVAEAFRVTEGNPLYVEQVLRLLATRGSEAIGADQIAIPFTMREAIRARLSSLPSPARPVVEIASVLGQEMSVSLLAAIAGQPQSDVAAQVAAAVATGVFVERTPGRVAFSHILLRDELYAGIDAERRTAIHARAAATTAPEHSLDAIAHHAIASVGVLGGERVVSAVLRAAERSMELLAFEAAASLLDRAHQLLEPAIAPLSAIELLLARGVASIRLGEIQRGKQACERAADLARSIGAHRELARAALTYGIEYTPALVDRRLVTLLEESLAVLPADEHALRARALARLAAALQPAPDPGVPIRMAREAIASARSLDASTRRATFYAAASAMADWGDPHERIAINTEMVDLAEGAGDKVQQLRSHARLVFDFMEAGDVARADLHLDLHETLAKEFREPRYRWHSPLMRAMRALFAGRYDDVDRLQREAEAAMRSQPTDFAFQAALLWQRCHRLLDEDRFDDLQGLEERVRAALAPLPIGPLLLCIHLGRFHARRGEREQTATQLAGLGDVPLPSAGPLIAAMLAEAIACGGTPAKRDEAYGVLLPFASRLVNLGFSGMAVEAPVSRLLGVLAGASGRTADALAHFDEAIARLERLGAPRWLARTRAERDEAARGRTSARPVPASTRPTPAAFALRLEGEYFEITYGETVLRLKDSQGLRILARLVEHTGQEQHVLILAGSSEDVAGDAGEAIDREAAASYKARLEDLRDDLEEAEKFGDAGRAERARTEIDALTTELARGFGLGGRSRRASSDVERARVNVQRHLKRAIQRIAEGDPALGRYLEKAVKTGTYCSYRAD